MTLRWVAFLGWPLVKALIFSTVVATAASQEPFVSKLILVVVSASLSAFGMVLAALVSTRRVRQRLEEQLDTHVAQPLLREIKAAQEDNGSD